MSGRDYEVRNTCRLCSGGLSKLLVLPDTPLANEYPREPITDQDTFPLYLCRCYQCGHVQLPIQVDPRRLFSDYQYKSGTSGVFRAHLQELAETITERIGTGKRVLDIGSNDGTLMNFLDGLGQFAFGVEPAANLARENHGASTHIGFWGVHTAKLLTSAAYPLGTAWDNPSIRFPESKPLDCIVSTNVFAHVKDIEDFTEGVALALKDDGLFVFEVGWLVDIMEKGHFDVVYHEHLDYHQLRCLIPFLARYGLQVIDAEHVDSQGGSIRVWARKTDEKPGVVPNVDKLVLREERLDVRSLPKTMMLTCGEIREALREAPHPIVGYGCPAKFTTLTYAFGLPSKVRSTHVIYEDNKLKQWRYTPGTCIPIKPTSELFWKINNDESPGTIVIWAWNFADDIAARLRRSGFDGQILVPMPTVRTL